MDLFQPRVWVGDPSVDDAQRVACIMTRYHRYGRLPITGATFLIVFPSLMMWWVSIKEPPHGLVYAIPDAAIAALASMLVAWLATIRYQRRFRNFRTSGAILPAPRAVVSVPKRYDNPAYDRLNPVVMSDILSKYFWGQLVELHPREKDLDDDTIYWSVKSDINNAFRQLGHDATMKYRHLVSEKNKAVKAKLDSASSK